MRRVLIAALTGALVVVGWAGTGWAAGGSTTGNGRRSVPGSHPSWAVARNRVGNVAKDAGIVARVYLRGQNDAGLEAVARAVSDPASASYHHFLTPAAVRARFAPSTATVDTVKAWLQGSSLDVLDVPANNLYVEVIGNAAQMASTFGVTLGEYNVA